MDARRAARMVIDPKVRQVGFVTPGAPPDRTQSGPAAGSSPPVSDTSAGNSLSPVMIPPSRHASDNLSASVGAARPIPVPVPSPRWRPSMGDNVSVGSSNPSESVIGTSQMLSPSSRTDDIEFGEEMSAVGRSNSGRFVAASYPSGGIESATMKSPLNFPGPSNLTTVSVLKSVEGEGPLVDVQNDRVVSSKPQPLKEKTSKAERRALQESQRAAKAAAKNSGEASKPTAASGGAAPVNAKQAKVAKPPSQKKDGASIAPSAAASEKKVVDRPPEKDRKKDVPAPRMQFDDEQRVGKAKKRAMVRQTEARNRVELFRHLPQYVHGTLLPDLESKFFKFDTIAKLDLMHPAVYKVGLQYLAGDISGGNARCVAMLLAFQEAIRDYFTPPEKNLNRDLTAKISSYISFLFECRPLSISMGNAIRFLKNRIATLPSTLSESEAKAALQLDIDRFINEKIVLADKAIVRHAVTKIGDGEVILMPSQRCLGGRS